MSGLVYRRLLRPLAFSFQPETSHRLGAGLLDGLAAAPFLRSAFRAWCAPRTRPVEAFGQVLQCPVGLAAGFDKNAQHLDGLAALGFGFLEVGSVTARPWRGNPQPRLFRLPDDRALVNRMGLNNDGAEVVAARLAARRPGSPAILANVAKTPDPALLGDEAIEDYARSVSLLAPVADAVVVNVSCPNSGDGRTFEQAEPLATLVGRCRALVPASKALLVKFSSDLGPETTVALAGVAADQGADGFVLTNTSVSREGLSTPRATLEALGAGGLSGAPLLARSLAAVGAVRRHFGPKPLILGVGGVDSPEAAAAHQEAGANLVELYTGLVYGGPRTVRRVAAGWR